MAESQLPELAADGGPLLRRCARCTKWKDPHTEFRIETGGPHAGKPSRWCLTCEERDARGDGKSGSERFAEKRERILASDVAKEVDAAGDDFDALEKVAADRKGPALAALWEKVLSGDPGAVKLWFEIAGRPRAGQGGDEEWRGLQRTNGGR